MFLYDEVDEGYVTLDDDLMETLEDAHTKMQIALDQLQGQQYSRMLIYLTLPEEGDETFAFLDEMHEIAGQYYDKTEVLVPGESWFLCLDIDQSHRLHHQKTSVQ